ncbi:aldehyde dehydrogenase, partial [Rhodococcus opacus M213]
PSPWQATTPTGHPTVDRALDELSTGEKTRASLPLSARRALLERVRDLTAAHAEEWVAAATAIKELDPSSPLVGEEWISGPYAFAGGAATLAHSLASLETGTSPIAAATFGSAPGGRTTVRVLPLGIFDRLLLNGFSADVWLQPGTDVERAKQTAGQ